MRLLITGHRGFIGQHLYRELSDDGHVVAGADIDSVTPIDLSRAGVIEHVLHSTGPDTVVHLAAQVGRVFGERDLRHTIESNALMTTELARQCGERGIAVLYASTSEVYGDQGSHQVCYEDTPQRLPHNLYGLSKRWGEEALRLYAPEGLQIARLSMPYGPGAPPGEGRRALDNILWQAHHSMPIPIHEGASRSWCWVEDTTRALRLILEKGEAGFIEGAPAHGVYNVGRDDDELTMQELAIMACALAGACEKLIELVAPPAAQTVVKRLSTAKLSLLGWEPTVELSEGLPQVLDWVRQFDEHGRRL